MRRSYAQNLDIGPIDSYFPYLFGGEIFLSIDETSITIHDIEQNPYQRLIAVRNYQQQQKNNIINIWLIYGIMHDA